MSTLRLRRVAGLALLAVVLVGLGAAAVFRLHGGRWERVETPSMGTTAPVGSLLWVEPLGSGALHVGDFISFHPPGRPDVSYSHRVHAIGSDGTFTTKGEISGVDPWTASRADVVGRVVRVTSGVGWLVLATPVLVVGGVLTAGLVLLVRRGAALSLSIVGAGLTLAVALAVHQPLTRAEQLSFTQVPGGARASYVSTGLLPVRVSSPSGDQVDLGPGQVGTVTSTRAQGGRYAVEVAPHVPPWFWLLLVLGCFVPALWTLATGVEVRRGGRHVAAAA